MDKSNFDENKDKMKIVEEVYEKLQAETEKIRQERHHMQYESRDKEFDSEYREFIFGAKCRKHSLIYLGVVPLQELCEYLIMRKDGKAEETLKKLPKPTFCTNVKISYCGICAEGIYEPRFPEKKSVVL